jgi:hypothetical protein
MHGENVLERKIAKKLEDKIPPNAMKDLNARSGGGGGGGGGQKYVGLKKQIWW